VRTLFDASGMAIARIETMLNVSEFKEREDALADLALYDALTGLPNRALLDERLALAMARVARHRTLCAVVFLDLDDFKEVNDTHGHAVGDRLLSAVADRLQRHVRATDTIARVGGDEFVVVLEDLYSEEAALSGGRKLLESLRDPLVAGDVSFAVSASVGIAVAPRCSRVPAELLALADGEMYAVKGAGAGSVRLHGRCTRSSPDPAPYASLQSA
jgi:diguanylate cyclase (GGDEF)-like protein